MWEMIVFDWNEAATSSIKNVSIMVEIILC